MVSALPSQGWHLMVIKYVAFTWQGHKVEGVLDVATEEEAREQLQNEHLIPYQLETVRPRRTLVQIAPGLFPTKPKELIEFTRGLSALLRSGIQLRESLIILREQSSALGMKEVLRRVIEDIEGGRRFSEACAQHPSVFSDFYSSLLKVGEAGGGMAVTLQQLADTLEKRKLMRDRVKAALIYPVISLVVAIAVAIILVTYSLPSLVGLLTEYGGTLPAVTQLLITVSDFVETNGLKLFASMGGTVLALALGVRTRMGARLRDKLFLKIPIVSTVLIRSNLFSLTATFSRLLDAGIPTVDALGLCKESLNNVVLKDRLDNVTKEATSGTRVGPSFRLHWPTPPLLSQAIVTGEVSGSLSDALHGLADYYEQEATKAVSAATELIQPVVIIMVALLVGFVAVAVISGIYSAIGTVR